MRGLYRDKSNKTHLVVIGTTARYRSVLSHFLLILSRVCLWGQPHLSAFYTLCLMWFPTFGKTNIVLRFFSVHILQPSVKANINFNCPYRHRRPNTPVDGTRPLRRATADDFGRPSFHDACGHACGSTTACAWGGSPWNRAFVKVTCSCPTCLISSRR